MSARRKRAEASEFKKYILSVMPFTNYENLHKIMGLGRTWTLHLMMHPEKMSYKFIQEVAKACNRPEITAKSLVNKFGCGSEVISKSQYDSIMKP